MKKGANLGRLNGNERKRSKGLKHNREDSLNRDLTSNRLALNTKLRHYGADAMTLDWDEFDSIPDIGDIEK